MKTRFSVVLFAAVGLAALAACAPDEDEDDQEEIGTDDDELKALELKCKSGGTTFDLKANSGSLDTGAFKTAFTCTAPKGDAGKPAAVVTCTERAQKVHPGKWTASVTPSGGAYKATVKRGNAGDLTLACSVVAKADAGPAADAGKGGPVQPPPPAGVPTHAEVAPIIESTCGPCHGATFGTIDGLKKRKKQMLDALNSGRMPKNKPAWHLSDDGKKLIDFLQNSKEL